MREDWFSLVKLGSQELEIQPGANMERRKVTVTSYRVSLLDEDNLVGGMKIPWDALAEAGIIYDVGPRFLESDVAQGPVRKKRDERTVVTVTVRGKLGSDIMLITETILREGVEK